MSVQQTVLGWIADNITAEIDEVEFVNASVDIYPKTINLSLRVNG
ncbi:MULTISPECIES: hypothetical protein [unclassified Archaeoglobus]|jgi:hypothetical protein|nr:MULTISPECIES: hypothetical protein [unclassified Archaeoglobus]